MSGTANGGRSNPLTFEYFSGEYPQYITEALEKIRVNDRNSTNKPSLATE